jgi:hypothetical protein
LLAAAEKQMSVNALISANQKESFKRLQNEKSLLEADLKAVRENFSREVDKLHSSLKISDQRYRALESKTLLDADRDKQLTIKLNKEISDLKKSLTEEIANSKKQFEKQQTVLSENILFRYRITSNRLKQIESKLTITKNRS